jgi:phosphosulfolactate synthase (CoM biosynthesis protein A)
MERTMERSFDFLPINERGRKPRTTGITEMRGPYYAPVGKRYLQDILETMGAYVDIFKFSGGSFRLMPKKAVSDLIDTCHEHDVLVSTGGFIERVLIHGPGMVDRYLEECRDMGFDIVEVSSGFISIPLDDLLGIVARVRELGMKAKPEIGIQFGAGGASSVEELEAMGTSDPSQAVRAAKRYLEAGAHLIMVESEGVTENVRSWRTDVVSKIVNELGLDKVMFEAADPSVFSWYIKNFGPDVNLFVDHSQVVQLEALRSGIWGTKSTWGRVVTYRGKPEKAATARPKLVEPATKSEKR